MADCHPIYGVTQGNLHPGNLSGANFVAAANGLFALADVKAIEAADGIDADNKIESNNTPRAAEKGVRLRDKVNSGNPCKVFIAMDTLTADEITIAFVGDKTESGLAANNMLEISARNVTRRVALAAVDLVDRRGGTLNHQAAILLGMAQNMTPKPTKETPRRMTRLREVFSKHLGIKDDPFEDYRPGAGWVPRFKIVDKRGAADERAKTRAERRTESYDPEHHDRHADNDQDRPFDEEDDAAGEFLKSRNASA